MSLLNKWLQSLISLKGLVLISGILLLSGFIRPDSTLVLERWFFQLAQGLSSSHQQSADIALIELDRASVMKLQRDPGQSELLPLLLQKSSQVGLVLDHPLQGDNAATQRLLNLLETSKVAPEVLQTWREQNQRAIKLQQRLLQGDILVGLTEAGVSGFPEQALLVKQVDGVAWGALSWLPADVLAWLRESMGRHSGLQARHWPVDPRLAGAAYRAVDGAVTNGPRQIIWEQESRLHAGLELTLYTRQLANKLKLEEQPVISFDGDYAVAVGQSLQPISQSGSVWVPSAGIRQVARFSQAQALANPPSEKVWILASDPLVGEVVAATLSALITQQAPVQPSWGAWLIGVLAVVGVVYLVWIQPLFRNSMAMMLLVFILIALSVVQVVWQLSFRQILPLPLVMVWFAFGSVIMLAWKQRYKQWRQLQLENHNISYQLGHQWYQQGRMEDSIAALRPCQSTDAVLTLLYDIGVQQERKRQYQEAARTYQLLVDRKPKFKDARKRAEALQQLSEPVQVTTDFSATHSLVMPSQELKKPVLGRYEIERELGRGAMGVVYLGLDPKISRRVAIKTLSFRDFDTAQLNVIKERFFREAEAAGRLNHPNIVTVYDVGEETDLAFIAMDYVEGKSLDRCVSETALLPICEVYEIIAAVADALAYAHQQNIVHRDIKPGNIMYDPTNGRVKVADFGIARIVDDSKTKTGDLLGSPVYMSPEQLKGAKVTGTSDVYSLGVTFYQLLTGTLPFSGDSIANLAYQILNKKFVSVREIRPELSAGVVRVVNKALQKDPSKRFENAAEMASAVRALLDREFGRSDRRVG